MNIIIIGNGISGITAARYIRKLSDHHITVISDESDYFFSRTALMYVYMGHMRFQDIQPFETWFWAKNKIELLRARVRSVNVSAKSVELDIGTTLPYDRLIIATGSRSNKFGWPGQDLDGVHGLYHVQDLEAMNRHSGGLNQAVIVGGGLIGVEMAEMFHSRQIPVTFLVRESNFWNNVLPEEESALITRHIREHNIDLRLNTELKEIMPDNKGQCKAVVTSDGQQIDCGFVGLTVGVTPNIEWLKNSGIELGKGILVDQWLQTSATDVYAIGDCAEIRQPTSGRRAIEAVWYTGRMMGETVARTICGRAMTYNPGIWFNSAKFFDIEYQVYGQILPGAEGQNSSVYWEHPDGKKSIRVAFDPDSGAVTGFNLLGIRYRHEVCEIWLENGEHIETVLENLGIANFDPEFFPQHEADLVGTYNRKFGKQLKLIQTRNPQAALNFLG